MMIVTGLMAIKYLCKKLCIICRYYFLHIRKDEKPFITHCILYLGNSIVLYGTYYRQIKIKKIRLQNHKPSIS